MRGAFTFVLAPSPYVPRVQVKRIGARAAFIRLTVPKLSQPEWRGRRRGGDQANHRGYFIDVATTAAAVAGHKGGLGALAGLLGVPTPKGTVEAHGELLSDAYLDYARTDVQTTWECHRALETRYQGLGLAKTPLHRIYSEASLGKAHLVEMGLRPWREAQSEVPDWVIATVMETYYGGRAECHVRNTAVPGVLVDFTSQYPTVFTLQGLDRYLLADGVDWAWEDPGEVQGLLAAVTPEQLLADDHAIWRRLDCLVEIAPDADLLPTRARYARAGPGSRGSAMNVAVARRSGGPTPWYTLADALASALTTGRAPQITRVLRFTPRARQALQPIDLAGDPRYRIDPNTCDPIRAWVEHRARLKNEAAHAKASGDHVRAAGLDAAQRNAKVTANAIAYGVPIEMNVIEHAGKVEAIVHRPDGSSYATKVRRTEEPGRWFQPLIATWVAGAGRLLLALAMRLVSDARGEWCFCDTDSLFVVATPEGGDHDGIPALSHQAVRELVGRFAALNPYDPEMVPGSILKVETPIDGEAVYALSVAAKRYALFTRDPAGRPRILEADGERKRSEHALGHLQPPIEPDAETERGRWIDELWEHLISVHLGLEAPPPQWFELAACGRLAITSPNEERAFAAWNRDRPYPQRVRPWGFVSTCRPHRLERSGPRGLTTLVAPFERDPVKRMRQSWFDRHDRTGRAHRVRVGSPDHVISGRVVVESYGDYFAEYAGHPEAKAAGPDGQACRPWTTGVLQPRHVAASGLVRIGKETNRLAEDPSLIDDPEDLAVEYPEPVCGSCAGPLAGRQRQWCSEGCRKRSGRRGSAAS